MALKLKTKSNNRRAIERAARRRILDEPSGELLSEAQLNQRVNKFLREIENNFLPQFRTSFPLTASTYVTFIRNTKFFIGVDNGELSDLEKTIQSFSKYSFGALQNLHRELKAIDSSTTEEEIAVRQRYDFVHHNAFVRAIDGDIGRDSELWLVDYKTGLPFHSDNYMKPTQGLGLHLPINERVKIPIIDAILIGEETDVGDTRYVLHSTSPRYSFLPNRVFRHIIVRREHDETTRKYKRTPSYCTLQFELPGLQLINYLKITPASHAPLIIEEISYINESGEHVRLSADKLEAYTDLVFLIEPIRTRYLVIKFAQYTPVSKSQLQASDLTKTKINETLTGLGWENLFPVKQDFIQGRVFDFSIADIDVGLHIYEGLGVFRSRDIDVKNISSLSLKTRTESIDINNVVLNYGSGFEFPDAEILLEPYIGIRAQDQDKNKVIEDLIPLPNRGTIEAEYLVFSGSDARLRLFPDLLFPFVNNRVMSSDPGNRPLLIITTKNPHGFTAGETVGFLAPNGHPLNGRRQIRTILDEYRFTVRVKDWKPKYKLTENDTPYTYVFSNQDETDLAEAPLKLYRDGEELVIGRDYEISLDGGKNFLTTFKDLSKLASFYSRPRSGNCYIRLLKTDIDKTYWVKYQVWREQFLGQTNMVFLRNNKVVFSNDLKNTKAKLNTVLILRAGTFSPLLTTIVNSYTLKIRESNVV